MAGAMLLKHNGHEDEEGERAREESEMRLRVMVREWGGWLTNQCAERGNDSSST